MTTEKSATAAQLLEGMLAGDRLKPQYERYMNVGIRNGDSGYTRTLAKEGREAAEKNLQEWDARDRMSAFAAAIEPVARGMLALARTDTQGKHTAVVEVDERMAFPKCYDIKGPSQMVVTFNHQVPGYAGLALSGIFGSYAHLGLKAVTLQAGDGSYIGYSGPAAQLGLVLPYRARSEKEPVVDGYTVVAIDLRGLTRCHSYSVSLHAGSYLRYALGRVSLDRAISTTQSSSSDLGETLGFPGAVDYLANNLPKLGTYFTALAAQRSGGHNG